MFSSLITTIDGLVRDAIAPFYPPIYSDEPQVADLINRTPCKLSLIDGQLASTKYHPDDVYPGSPSPFILLLGAINLIAGLWMIADVLNVLLNDVDLVSAMYHHVDAIPKIDFPWWAILAIAFAFTRMTGLRGYGVIVDTLAFILCGVAAYLFSGTAAGATALLYNSAYIPSLNLVWVPALATLLSAYVLAERDASFGASVQATIWMFVQASRGIRLFFKLVGFLLRGGFTAKFFGVALLVLLAPFLMPVLAMLFAVTAIFADDLYFSGFNLARKNRIREYSKESAPAALQQDFRKFTEDLKEQVELARSDMSPWFGYGRSRHVLRGDGDMMTPDKDGWLGQTVKDMGESALILLEGLPGMGKTVLFRRMIYWWVYETKRLGGTLVMDGDKSLPLQIKAFMPADYILIDPFRTHMNIIKGLTPATMASTLVATLGKKGDGPWNDATRSMLQNGGNCLELWEGVTKNGVLGSIEAHYSFADVTRFCSDESFREPILEALSRLNATADWLEASLRYWRVKHKALMAEAGETAQGMQFTLDSMTELIASHKQMSRWAGHQNDYDFVDIVTKGGHVGIYAPSDKCGAGGAAAIELLKRIFNTHIDGRAHNQSWRKTEKIVTQFIDEANSIMSVDESGDRSSVDAKTYKISRELGLIPVVSYQMLEQMEAKLGDKTRANTLLGLAKTRIGFYSTDPTLEGMSNHAGSRHRFIADKQKVRSSDLGDAVRAHVASAGDSVGKFEDLVGAVSSALSVFAKRFGLSSQDKEKIDDVDKRSNVEGTYEMLPVISKDELKYHLRRKLTALVTVYRAGHVRREICDMTPEDWNHPCFAGLDLDTINDDVIEDELEKLVASLNRGESAVSQQLVTEEVALEEATDIEIALECASESRKQARRRFKAAMESLQAVATEATV